MELALAATTLRNQLIALHNSDTTLSALDKQVTSLGQQSLMSVVEDDQSTHLRLVLRLSINEGVQNMYRKYTEKKWIEVQNTARSIRSHLEADDTQQTTPVISSPEGGTTTADKAAEVWSSVFCELSRHE